MKEIIFAIVDDVDMSCSLVL